MTEPRTALAGWHRGRSFAACLVALALALCAAPAWAHDAAAWGGLFRSRDSGATWVLASPGRHPTAAVALDVSSTDPNHLLLATDSGLLRSRNAGRDWSLEAPRVLSGAVLAAALGADGRQALVATSAGVFRGTGEEDWRPTSIPRGATPARAIVRGAGPARAYLAGWVGLFRTDDWGTSWSNAARGLPAMPATALVVAPGPPESLHVVIAGDIWSSTDSAQTWVKRTVGTPGVKIDALGLDSSRPEALWAAGTDRLLRSEDRGASWQVVRALPEPNIVVHTILTVGTTILLATSRGLYRTTDDDRPWELMVENLPGHLEAGPLARDPADPETVYAGFSVAPYAELWRRAAEGAATLERSRRTRLLAGVALLVAVALSAGVVLLRRHPRAREPAVPGLGARPARPRIEDEPR